MSTPDYRPFLHRSTSYRGADKHPFPSRVVIDHITGCDSRDRVLATDELRRVWTAAEAEGLIGQAVKLLLLTAFSPLVYRLRIE